MSILVRRKNFLKKHLIPRFGALTMKAIESDPEAVQAWVSGLKLEPKSVKNIVTTARLMFDDTDIFTRVDADMTSFSIAVSSKRIEIDDDGKYKFGQSSADYDLGEGVYKSSEAEFRTAIVDAKEMLSKIERKAWG